MIPYLLLWRMLPVYMQNVSKRQKTTKQQIPQSKWPDELKNEITQNDDENHFAIFGDNSSQHLLPERLREAMKNKY